MRGNWLKHGKASRARVRVRVEDLNHALTNLTLTLTLTQAKKRSYGASQPGVTYRTIRVGGGFGRPDSLQHLAEVHGGTRCDSRIRRKQDAMWIVPWVDRHTLR